MFGLTFLWAFFDKLLALGFHTGVMTDPATGATTTDRFGDAAWINGGSPTEGFLTYGTKGPFAEFFQSFAGAAWADWLFMLGLLGIGVALTLGAGIRIAAITGAVMYLAMYAAAMLPENNPVLDDHLIGAMAWSSWPSPCRATPGASAAGGPRPGSSEVPDPAVGDRNHEPGPAGPGSLVSAAVRTLWRVSQPIPPSRGAEVVAVVLASVVALLLLVGVLLAPFLAALFPAEETGEKGAGPTALDDVRTWKITERHHTEDDVDYDQTPPAGGPHRRIWLDCGVYDDPVEDEYAVHDLEHGTVWITYDPEDVDADGVRALEERLPDNGILSPYPGLPAPVVVTVWGNQLRLTGPDDGGLVAFIRKFSDGSTAPEPMSSCHGGVRDPDEDGNGAEV